MKIYFTLVIFSCLALLGLCQTAPAQSRTKTFVLVRHAEKEATPPNDPDPDLSAAGRERAQRLLKVVMRYKPHEIFSTNFKRTRNTVAPLAARRKKEVQIYDAGKAADLVAKMMASKTDHHLIVGHSNTIPSVANLLAKKEIFRNLVEAEYGVIWVIRLRDGVLTKVEVLPY